jgi:outer membrane protein TolC
LRRNRSKWIITMQVAIFAQTALVGILILGGCVASEERAAIVEERLEAHLQGSVVEGTASAAPGVSRNDFEGAVKAAVESSAAFASARALEAAAMAQVGTAKAAQRPQVSATASGGTLKEGSPVDNTITGVAADLMVSQLVYDGGASNAAMNGALAQALAARASAQEAGNSAALEAVRAWAELWAVQQQMGFLTSRGAEVGVLLEQVDRMTENGMLDSATRDSARMAVSDMQIEETALLSALTGAEARFARHFGAVPAQKLARPTALYTTAALSDLAKDVSLAPTLRKIAAELVAAEAAESQARAQFKPIINLNLGMTSPMDKNDGTDTTVGLQMRYTFNDGGRRKAQLQTAVARKEAAAASLQAAKAEAEAMSVASLARLRALDTSAGLVDKKLEAAASQAATAASQVSLGQSTLRGVIDAQIAEYRAQEQQIKLIADRVVLQATIAASMGILLNRLRVE